jgi:hypothetical protein
MHVHARSALETWPPITPCKVVAHKYMIIFYMLKKKRLEVNE